ncbi:MAG: hypothetical protein I8H66_10070 [Sphingobacteriia bacterium]|nr:hypothetical protein [Sphingobacteriia bacterium]
MGKKFSNLGTILTRKNIKAFKCGDGTNKCAVACSSNNDCDSVCTSCEKGAWGDQKICFNAGGSFEQLQ